MVDKKEDLICPLNITTITPISNWQNRFEDYNYSEEQKRIVNLSLKKMEEVFVLNDLKDWKCERERKGFRLDTRKSERGNNNIYKVTCNMQFSPWDIFQVICASDLR